MAHLDELNILVQQQMMTEGKSSILSEAALQISEPETATLNKQDKEKGLECSVCSKKCASALT